MTAKEKAEALFRAMYWPMFKIRYNGGEAEKREAAKQCALIAVDEILNQSLSALKMIENSFKIEFHRQHIAFWQQVKEEIGNL